MQNDVCLPLSLYMHSYVCTKSYFTYFIQLSISYYILVMGAACQVIIIVMQVCQLSRIFRESHGSFTHLNDFSGKSFGLMDILQMFIIEINVAV